MGQEAATTAIGAIANATCGPGCRVGHWLHIEHGSQRYLPPGPSLITVHESETCVAMEAREAPFTGEGGHTNAIIYAQDYFSIVPSVGSNARQTPMYDIPSRRAINLLLPGSQRSFHNCNKYNKRTKSDAWVSARVMPGLMPAVSHLAVPRPYYPYSRRHLR